MLNLQIKVNKKASVFSSKRILKAPSIIIPKGYRLNTKMKMDGIKFLSKLPNKSFSVAFFDPQYRGVLDSLHYGNEGKKRSKARCRLTQMTESLILTFIAGLNRVLIPSGHLFLWVDKFHLCTGISSWLHQTDLSIVDMITWNKDRMGMGYRTRRSSEYLLVLQKYPKRAKGVWKIHSIPDVWKEEVNRTHHIHTKPLDLQSVLIAAVSNKGDIVIDPAAGSFSVMEACKKQSRNFLGCDINK